MKAKIEADNAARAGAANVAIHRYCHSKPVQLQHELLCTRGAPAEALADFMVEFLYRAAEAKEKGDEEGHIVLSYGIIAPIADKQDFEKKYMTSMRRKFAAFSCCTYEQFRCNSTYIFKLRLLREVSTANNKSDVFAQYQCVKAYGCCHIVTGSLTKCYDCTGLFGCAECHRVINSHIFEPKKSTTIRCLRCYSDYSFAKSCRSCGLSFGNYSCAICKINRFVSAHETPVLHCAKCDSCHEYVDDLMSVCKRCRYCYVTANGHICQKGDCSICLCSLASGSHPYDTRCFHPLHSECAQQLLEQYDYRCPICRRIFLNKADYKLAFSLLVRRHQSFFLGTESALSVLRIQCFDCQRTFYRAAHPSGVYFCACGSFNNELLEKIDDCGRAETDLWGPVKYYFSDAASVCAFLFKRHAKEIVADGCTADTGKEAVLTSIFERLGLPRSSVSCNLIALVYSEKIHSLSDLEARVYFIRGIQRGFWSFA